MYLYVDTVKKSGRAEKTLKMQTLHVTQHVSVLVIRRTCKYLYVT